MRPRAIGTAMSAIVFVALTCGCSSETHMTPPVSQPIASSSAAAAAVRPPAVPINQISPDLPLLPDGLVSAPRPVSTVKAVYEFAAQHPDVLDYIPCFCGCERGGHKHNDDCFVAKRDAAGKVTEWESHGMVCEICIDVAELAMQLHYSGASTAEIRDVVEQKYAALTEQRHTHTPTPPVPKGRGSSRH